MTFVDLIATGEADSLSVALDYCLEHGTAFFCIRSGSGSVSRSWSGSGSRSRSRSRSWCV
jgi:hypothetical protein